MSLVISKDYAYVLLSAVAMSFQITLVGAWPGKFRRQFGLEYPDMGNGRHSGKLTDDQWKIFNNAQRVHYNYLENFGPNIVCLLISGLFQPKVTAGLAVSYIVGRYLYGSGYMSQAGPKGRYRGSLFIYVASLSWIGISMYGCIKMLTA
ncbi:hypothetical protein BJ742DRAFT_31044 [Cladochytrium replicatum]|nr:hypothetical protein BJ742DRAFT_31044 [Cladochytrium replicatum]